MKIVLDANVFISALATRGICMELLADLHQSHDVVLAACVLREVERVLLTKFRVPPPLVAEKLGWLRSRCSVVGDAVTIGRWSRDADDDLVIAIALEIGATAIVTGDADLLILGIVEGVSMVAPRDWRRFEAIGRT